MSQQPDWASTDLRWRTKSGAEAPLDRGFLEDYGDDDSKNRGGFFARQWLCLWRLRTMSYYVSVPLLSAVAVCASAISIQFVGDSIVIAASALTITIALLLLFQRRKLRRHGTLRHENNELKRRVYFMRQERERLHRTLDRLDETVADLHSVPQELHKLTKNRNVDRLLQVVEEQKRLQELMRVKIGQQVMQQILTLVVREDRDQNWTLRPTEVEALIVRLGLLENVDFDERQFRELLTDDPTVSTIMKILRSLLERDDEYQHGRPIFKINT